MKKTHSRIPSSRSSGFTLVELLVVMAIIAILVGVLTAAVGAAMRMAMRTKAANMATQIQTACTGYYTEYGLYPVPTVATPVDTLIGDSTAAAGASWATLDSVLCGNTSPSTGAVFTPPAAGPSNTRGIVFLSFKSTDVYTAADHTANVNAIVDAPKNPLPATTSAALFFSIAFDSDYSGIMGNGAGTPPSALTAGATTGLPNFAKSTKGAMDWTGTSTAGVAVWANCNGTTSAASLNPNYYVHTY